MIGDEYNNNGNNFGHIGPVNNFNRPKFQLIQQIVEHIVRSCPSEKPVWSNLVGPVNLTDPIQATLLQALRTAGLKVTASSAVIDATIDWPNAPVSIDTGSPLTKVLIVPLA